MIGAGAALPLVLGWTLSARVRNEQMTRGSAVGMLALTSFALPVAFWFLTLAVASFVNANGGSSVWNGDAALGALVLAVALGVWSLLCTAMFAVTTRA